MRDRTLGPGARYPLRRIEDLAIHVGSGQTPRGGSDVYSNEGILFIRSQNVRFSGLDLTDAAFIDERTHRLMMRSAVFAFDVLLNITGASIGRCCVVPAGLGEANVNQHVCAIRLETRNRGDASFLNAVLASHIGQSQVDRLNAGGNREGLNFQQVRSFEVPWPDSRIRHRIAEVLDTLDRAISETEQIIAKLYEIQQGLTHDLLTNGISDRGTLRDPGREPEEFRTSPLGQIPVGWRIERLLDMVSLPSGQCDPRLEPFRSRILVAPDHIESGTGRLLERRTAQEQGAISGKYVFEPHDVVYSKIRPYLRKAILAGFSGICSADMYPLRSGAEVVPRYLLALVLGEDFSRFAEAVSMRSGFPKINREELAEYMAPFPPVPEQERIASVLQAMDNRQESERRELEKLREIKSGLVDDLLTGKIPITVPERAVA